MRKVKLGRVEIVSDPGSAQRPLPGTALPRSNHALDVESVAPEQAQAKAGFKIWQLGLLPQQVHLVRMDLAWSSNGKRREVMSAATKYRADDGRWLVLHRSRIFDTPEHPHEERIPFEVTQGTVAGRPAVVYSYFVQAQALPGGQLQIVNCAWEHDGFLMRLQAPVSTTNDVTQLASSLV